MNGSIDCQVIFREPQVYEVGDKVVTSHGIGEIRKKYAPNFCHVYGDGWADIYFSHQLALLPKEE
jgi:hypothetical protein